MLEEGGHRTVSPGADTEINLEAGKTGNGCKRVEMSTESGHLQQQHRMMGMYMS